MKNARPRAVVLGLLAAVSAVAATIIVLCRTGHEPSVSGVGGEKGISYPYDPDRPPALKANADELDQTIVTPHLDQTITGGKNVLWCSTFQLAWNELCALAGGDIHLEDEPPMVAVLNRNVATKADIDQSSCVAAAGFIGDGVIPRIENELKLKLPRLTYTELFELAKTLPEGWWIAYAYLAKSLPFEWAFTRFDRAMRFGGVSVTSFGIYQFLTCEPAEVKMAGQVSVLHYSGGDFLAGGERSDPEFVVELKTQSQADRMILAKITPADTLAETVRRVRERIRESEPTKIREGESLEIPVVDFDLMREYSELYGRAIIARSPKLNGSQIAIAKQKIRFRLDETGALLKSEALLALCEGFRRFVFDRPFLVLLQRQGARTPYFALWVANAELLTKFNRPPRNAGSD